MKKPEKTPEFLQTNEEFRQPTKNKIQHFDYSDLQAATNNFSDQKLLGRSSHGLVYKTLLRNGRMVAVKKPSHHHNHRLSAFSTVPDNEVDWAIPLNRRGKLLSVFDPRIPPPKDPVVRKQLAVIAAKCVRSCRERRPSMSEIVESLSSLAKLVPLRSWNGLSNPYLMVETVGRGGGHFFTANPRRQWRGGGGGGGGDGENQLSNARRVYSDLELRSNLMDLMATGVDIDNDEDTKRKVNRRSRLKNGDSCSLDQDPSIVETSNVSSSRFYIVTRWSRRGEEGGGGVQLVLEVKKVEGYFGLFNTHLTENVNTVSQKDENRNDL